MMKRKLILTGAALSLAVAMTGCGGNAVTNQQASSQAQLISMEAAQEVALKAANIAAENAAISATTLNEVAGTSCYKVEFTSGDYAYAYTVNAETGAVMEMSSRDKNAADTQAQTEATAPAAASDTTPAQTVTGTVDEETAQKIALEHAGVKATDATITKSKLDYEGRRQVYEIEWYAGGKKYDYEIAVDTGEILSSGYDEKQQGGVAAIASLSVRQMRSRQHLAVSVVQRRRTSTNGNSIMTMDVRNMKARSSMAERNMTLRSMHPVELS